MSKAGEKLIAASKELLAEIFALKPADERERRLGWAPGGYMSRCMDCKCSFIGDKRAIQCADCAYAETQTEATA